MGLQGRITLILLIISLNVVGNGALNSALFFASSGWWVVGLAPVINLEPKGTLHLYDWERSGVMISISQDPAMALQEIWDLKFKGGVKLDNWHPYVAYEWAGNPVNLEAYTAGTYYQFLDGKIKSCGNKYGYTLKAGYETGMIKNQGKKVWTNGLTVRGELWLRKHGVGFFLEGDYFTRPELVNPYAQFKWHWLDGVPSGRVGVFWFLL